jgi:hypothetical protein
MVGTLRTLRKPTPLSLRVGMYSMKEG